MNYHLFILRRAQKEIVQLPNTVYERVKGSIHRLAHDPRPRDCRKLSGRDGWRIRVGSYRVIYEINDTRRSVTVLHIGHRRDIYR